MVESNAPGISRRRFLKTAAGAFALASAPAVFIPRGVEAYQPGGKIHPYIDPLRVVGVRDPRMTTGVNEAAPWAVQEKMVAWDAVQTNMDRMAIALTGEKNEADAWRKIFLKPPGKSWSDVVVAVKTNQLGVQRTRSAVMSKLCHVLTDLMGVKGQNIYIYDACSGGSMPKSPYAGLPEGVHLANKWTGYNLRTTVPEPYLGGKRDSKCLDALVKGQVDILVDIALCKGHGRPFGGCTLTMKNHFGTFDPRPSHAKGGGADYLIGINKTKEILGEMDPRTGNVLFPRQQLCVIDALWASRPGPGGLPTAQPNALLMGTFGPAVDYLTAMRLRRDAMHWPVNEEVVTRFLTDFGFDVRSLPNGGQIIDAMAPVA